MGLVSVHTFLTALHRCAKIMRESFEDQQKALATHVKVTARHNDCEIIVEGPLEAVLQGVRQIPGNEWWRANNRTIFMD